MGRSYLAYTLLMITHSHSTVSHEPEPIAHPHAHDPAGAKTGFRMAPAVIDNSISTRGRGAGARTLGTGGSGSSVALSHSAGPTGSARCMRAVGCSLSRPLASRKTLVVASICSDVLDLYDAKKCVWLVAVNWRV